MKHLRLACAFLLCATPAAVAADPIVAPPVRFLRAVRHAPPRFLPRGIVSPERFAGSIRFSHALDAGEVRSLSAIGVRFARDPGGAPLHVGPVFPVTIAWDALDAVLAHPAVRQVESEPIVRPIPPLDVTRPLTGAPPLADLLSRGTGAEAGEGIRIADIDSGIDAYHPALFRADGGYFAWIDTDGNGTLDPGKDACDLDRDGVADPGETIRNHDAGLVNFYDPDHAYDELFGNGKIDLAYDWLYADSNGNGRRDYGPWAGFGEADPGYGEPVLVADDVDGDGVLDPAERLVLLATSKVERAFAGGVEYVRGKDLSKLDRGFFGTDGSGLPTAAHGTGVAGILAAGTPRSSRFLGIAPGATLLMADFSKEAGDDPEPDAGLLARMAWASGHDPHVVLYELSSWGDSFMDGTANADAAIDALTAQGVVNVAPAGNLAEAGKHAELLVQPGSTTIRLTVPSEWPAYPGVPFSTPILVVSLYWSGAADEVGLGVAPPGAAGPTDLPIGQEHGVPIGPDLAGYAAAETSSAGFGFLAAMIWDAAQVAVRPGTYAFEVRFSGPAPVMLHAYANDVASGWARGVTWTEHESAATTLCRPSTATSAITVGAYGGRFGSPAELGQVRGYSSRGPRIDGADGIDVVAPDDPYTPFAEWDLSVAGGSGWLHGGYWVFGGTSGAGPHVAGAVALLRQAHPEDAATAIADRLLAGAESDAGMGAVPNPVWGHGRLDAFRASTGTLAAPNLPPAASVSVAVDAGGNATLDASASTDPP
ncbi:MAG: S8 family serine peptidase, partial [Deltaproteobacteria bacterium]|nr:S8 family serine peptidase [Deltaproteobacteria bacterium]